MKKGIEFLHMLTKREQVLFLKNLSSPDVGRSTANHPDRNIAKYLNHNFDNFNTFILEAFTWISTPEGDDYWFGISLMYGQ